MSTDKRIEKEKVDEQNLVVQMSTKSGRDVVWWLLTSSGFFEEAYDADSHVHAYNSGGRAMGVWLWQEVNMAAPERVIEMMQENVDER